jgi:hypothetical protein
MHQFIVRNLKEGNHYDLYMTNGQSVLSFMGLDLVLVPLQYLPGKFSPNIMTRFPHSMNRITVSRVQIEVTVIVMSLCLSLNSRNDSLIQLDERCLASLSRIQVG